jgi:cyclopropane fatty-acyl-phospholipid synthase-like methyltransferase
MMDLRQLGPDGASTLAPGDRHYRAFVGPTARYDLMGAGQFALLYLLGLRETHRVLDFGCGSLRLGRFLIPYLRAGHYFGIEPEEWLVDDGFAYELGDAARSVKRPSFDFNAEFKTDVFGQTFDFIVAQSIFSHAGSEMTERALASFSQTIAPQGLVLANWLVGPETAEYPPETSGWVYPECLAFEESRIVALATQTGFHIRRCPWHHPGGLSWYLLANSEDALPEEAFLGQLAVVPRSS